MKLDWLYTVTRGWKRQHGMVRWGIVIVLAMTVFNIMYRLFLVDDAAPIKNNLIVFFLFYLSFIFLSVLAFLIGRNIVKLVFDRRNNILGAKLRTKLVVAFVSVAVITNIVLFVFAGGLLSNALKAFFSVQIEDAIQGAVDVAKYQYAVLKAESEKSTRIAVGRLQSLSFNQPEALLQKSVEEIRQDSNFFSISILKRDRQLLVSAHNAAAAVESFEEPILDSRGIDKAFSGQTVELFEERDAQNFIRQYRPLNDVVVQHKKPKKLLPAVDYVVVTSLRINPELSEALGRVNDTFRDYSQTKLFKDTLRTGYLLTLLLITGITLFGSVWFGFYLSKQLTTPIQALAQATDRIARGDYETKIDSSGDDELSFLANSFNNMIDTLSTTRDEAARRGAFIETILSRLGVAIVAVDLKKNVTQVNEASEHLFFGGRAPELPGQLPALLPPHVVSIIEPLLQSIDSDGGDTIREAEISLTVATDEKKLVCTVGSLNDSSGTRIGAVILFDDITEITKAQSIAVWREVAQRIAHEIKNPLTPIRLSAQRLQKLLKNAQHSETVLECAETIVQNVDSIKRLANEFSNFARMPTIEARETSLDAICRDILQLYSHATSDVSFQYIADQKIPKLFIDPDQMKRVLINLFDNAIDALQAVHSEARIIQLKTELDQKNHQVIIEVSDNGPGIPASDKIRIFEPYFTTKREGTGLGLGIVLSIISDHQGTIRIFDAAPNGSRFVISLPLEPLAATQRRLAGT